MNHFKMLIRLVCRSGIFAVLATVFSMATVSAEPVREFWLNWKRGPGNTAIIHGFNHDVQAGGDLEIPAIITSPWLQDRYPVIEIASLYDSNYVTGLIVPEGVETIRARVFNCHISPQLSSVSLPSTATLIEAGAFIGCPHRITIDSRNPNYCSVNNVVYSKDRSKLYFVSPMVSMTTVPDGVKEICDYAFSGNNNITELHFPKAITKIGSYVFDSCKNITRCFFDGPPPSATGKSFNATMKGYYTPRYAALWKNVLSAEGRWNGMLMSQRNYGTYNLPSSILSDTTLCSWIISELRGVGVKDGNVLIQESAEQLNSAYLAGIKPSISVDPNGATIQASVVMSTVSINLGTEPSVDCQLIAEQGAFDLADAPRGTFTCEYALCPDGNLWQPFISEWMFLEAAEKRLQIRFPLPADIRKNESAFFRIRLDK